MMFERVIGVNHVEVTVNHSQIEGDRLKQLVRQQVFQSSRRILPGIIHGCLSPGYACLRGH